MNLPIEAQPWHIGLIVGPSGSGKSTIAGEIFKAAGYPISQPQYTRVENGSRTFDAELLAVIQKL